MTTKQILFSAFIIVTTGSIALSSQETSTTSPHIVLNDIPMFKKIGNGFFIQEEIEQRAYTKKYNPDLFNEIPKLGVICNNKRFAIFNSNQESDCDLVLNKYNTLLKENRIGLNVCKEEIHNSEKKLATETNDVKKQDIVENLTLWNKSYTETQKRVKNLEKLLNAMNDIKE